MSSAILTIYDAFVAATVTVGGVVFTAKDADALPNGLTTAVLPLRLLAPLDVLGRENATDVPVYTLQNASFVTLATWRIYDHMYYRPLAQGIGQRTVNAVLLGYMADYLEMVRDVSRLTLPAAAQVQDVTLAADILEYPLGGGVYYYGVRAVVTIQELLN